MQQRSFDRLINSIIKHRCYTSIQVKSIMRNESKVSMQKGTKGNWPNILKIMISMRCKKINGCYPSHKGQSKINTFIIIYPNQNQSARKISDNYNVNFGLTTGYFPIFLFQVCNYKWVLKLSTQVHRYSHT